MSRFETATYPVRRSYVKDLIDFYRISVPREREALLQLCEDAWRKDWWEGEAVDPEHEFIDYTWLESRANRICVFEPVVVHGLLQTKHYARALVSADSTQVLTDDQVDDHVAFRMFRQRVLADPYGVSLWAILDESALRRIIGSEEILAEQLKQLVEKARQPNTEIRILPSSAGWQPGASEAFTYFEMPDPYSDVAFIENLAGQTFLEEEDKVARFRSAYDGLCKAALTSTASVELIRTIIEDLE